MTKKPFIIDLNKYSQGEALEVTRRLLRHSAYLWGVRLNSGLVGASSIVDFINEFRRLNLGVFVDLRLSHSPQGNAEWVEKLGKAGATWISVNAYEGYQALRAAVDAAPSGLTVLADISLPNCDQRERLYNCSASELLKRVVDEAAKANIGDFVCYDSSSPGLCHDSARVERTVVRTIWQIMDDRRVVELLRAGFGYLCFSIPDKIKVDPGQHLEELFRKVASTKSAA